MAKPERRRMKKGARVRKREKETEASNIRKMLVCGYVRREREKGCWTIYWVKRSTRVDVYAYVCGLTRWSGSTTGKHKTDAGNNAHPVVAPRRARKNRNMAVASHALFALLFFARRRFPGRLIDGSYQSAHVSHRVIFRPLAARRDAAQRFRASRGNSAGESSVRRRRRSKN